LFPDDDLVWAAALRVRDYTLKCLDGRTVRSVMQWRMLCESHGLDAGPVEACPDAFTADLRYDDEHDLWLAGYRWDAPDPLVCQWLCHEFAEYLTITDHAYLFDDLPRLRAEPNATAYVYHYEGDGDPQNIRHLIARAVERLIFGLGC
jgi:hypothetical protein